MMFFPQHMDMTFRNLEAIYMNDGILSVLTQSDMKPFPKLKFLDLFENKLEALPAGLFDFNPHLEVVWFSHNRIFEIAENVFDGLKSLQSLYLSGNACIGRSVSANKTEVLELIQQVKAQCAAGQVVTTTSKFFMRLNISGNEMDLQEVEMELKQTERENDKLANENWKLRMKNESQSGTVGRMEILVLFMAIVMSGMIIFGIVGYVKLNGMGREGRVVTMGQLLDS